MQPTKLCTICQHRKPWCDFYKTRTGNPRWACRKCETSLCAERQRVNRRADPEPLRAAARARYERNRQNPEWVAARRDYNRKQAERRRRARGVPERAKRGPTGAGVGEPAEFVPSAPFAAWLEGVMVRDGIGATTLAARLNVPDNLRQYMRGERERVLVSMVERCLIAEGTDMLMDVYPELYRGAL